MLPSLKRKPQALVNLTYREALFPSDVWCRTFEALLEALDSGMACRTMVGLLALAHDHGCEGALGQALGKTLGKGVLPDLKALQRRFALQHTPSVPEVSVNLPRASHYDALITGQGGAA